MLAAILNERNVRTVKVAIQCLATVYPLLFRQLYVVFRHVRKLSAHVHRDATGIDASTAGLSSSGTCYNKRRSKYWSLHGRKMPEWSQALGHQVRTKGHSGADEGSQ